MSKNNKSKEVTQDEFESALKSETAVFDGVALSVVKNSNREFKILKIAVDSKNLLAGEVEVVDVAGDRMEATEKFKILVVKNGLI